MSTMKVNRIDAENLVRASVKRMDDTVLSCLMDYIAAFAQYNDLLEISKLLPPNTEFLIVEKLKFKKKKKSKG